MASVSQFETVRLAGSNFTSAGAAWGVASPAAVKEADVSETGWPSWLASA